MQARRPEAIGAAVDRGTLTVQRAHQSHGRGCRAVQWHDVFKSGAGRSVLLQTCLGAGRWRLV